MLNCVVDGACAAVEEINDGGEIQCDRCDTWFHLACLALPQQFAVEVESWMCGRCYLSDQAPGGRRSRRRGK